MDGRNSNAPLAQSPNVSYKATAKLPNLFEKMKIYLRNQTKYLKTHLENLKLQEIIKYDKSQLKEKTTFVHINTNKDIQKLDTKLFWEYNIFPKNIMNFLTEWNDQKRQMQIGDTIVQQAFIPPVGSPFLVQFKSRIFSCFNQSYWA